MGYMGFGMRKEVYKRKPKKSFQKLKELYGNDTPKVKHDPNAPKLTSEDVLNKPRFRSIHDTKFFQIAKLLVIFSVVGAFLNFAFIQPWLFERRLTALKENLVKSYSEDHQFLLNSSEHLNLHYFKFDSFDNSFITAKKGIKFRGNGSYINRPEVARIGTWNTNAIDIELTDNNLKVIRNDSTQTLKDTWIVLFQSDTIDSRYNRIFGQLSINLEYVEELRKKLRATKIKEVEFENSSTTIQVADSKDYGTYEYVKSDEELRESKNTIKIDSLTYLRKKY